jgi:Transposase IS66 family
MRSGTLTPPDISTGARPPAASELGQLGAWRRDPYPARTESDDQGGVILDTDDPAEAVLIVCHLVAHGEVLGRRGEGRGAEGTCGQEGLGAGTGTFHYHQYALLAPAGSRLGPFMDRVRELLASVPVLYADETPARAAGKLHYVHVACTEFLTAMHTGDRTKQAIDAGGVLPGYTGTIVRDGYKGYEHLTDALHAWCGAQYAEPGIMAY